MRIVTNVKVAWLAMLFSALSVFALDYSELKSKLQQSRAQWEAEENPITALSLEEKKKLLGVPLSERFDSYFIDKNDKPIRQDLPSHFDWRDVKGVNYSSPVLHQGNCGSCVAFAAVSTLETQMNIARNTPNSPWKYSPQHLFSCGGGGCDMGWWPSSAASFLKSEGIPDEACFPYQSGATGKDLACNLTCTGVDKRLSYISDYSMPTFWFGSVEAVKEALLEGPLVTAFTVYEDFMFYKSGVYKHTTGDTLGGHAVSIMGWDDAERAWIVKNSWGESWGENGYFRIAWDDASGLGNQTWLYEIGEEEGYVLLPSITNGMELSQNLPIRISTTFKNVEKLQWEVYQEGSDRVVAFGNDLGELDTTQLEDGHYEIRAIAQHAKGVSISQPKQIKILNGDLTGKIEITNTTNGQKISGRYEFELSVDSAPIQFNRLSFMVRHVESGNIQLKSTPNIAAKMAYGWRTNFDENGTYEVKFIGETKNTSIESSTITVEVNN